MICRITPYRLLGFVAAILFSFGMTSGCSEKSTVAGPAEIGDGSDAQDGKDPDVDGQSDSDGDGDGSDDGAG